MAELLFQLRTPVGTREEYANVTFEVKRNFTIPYTMYFLVCNAIGLPANIFILYLSFFSKHLTGNFKYFMANLALCDLGFCLSFVFGWLFHLYHSFTDTPMSAVKCHIQCAYSVAFSYCMFFAVPLPSFNRYMVIVRGKDELFTNKVIVALCLNAYIPVLWPMFDLLFAPYVWELPAFPADCGLVLYTPWLPELLVVPGFVFGGVNLFCNFEIYRKLNEHKKRMRRAGVRSENRLSQERSILTAIVLQTLVIPYACIAPMGAVATLVAIFPSDWLWQFNFTFFCIGSGPSASCFRAADCLALLCVAYPTCDALVTLLVINSYRQAARAFFARFFSSGRRNNGDASMRGRRSSRRSTTNSLPAAINAITPINGQDLLLMARQKNRRMTVSPYL